MQILFPALSLLAALVLGIEGANQATGGDLYLSSLEMMSVAQILEAVPPPPTQNTSSQLPPQQPPQPPLQQPPTGFQPQTTQQPPSTGEQMMPKPLDQQNGQFSPQSSPFPSQGGFQSQGEQRGQFPFPSQGGFQSQGEQRGQFPPMMPPPPMMNRDQQFQGDKFPPQFQQPQSQQQPKPSMKENQQNGQRQNGNGLENEESDQKPTVNPQEVKQVLREVNQMKSQLNGLAAKYRKLQNSGTEQSKIGELKSSLDAIKSALQGNASEDDVFAALEEFHNGDFRDEVQKLQLKLQIPNEIKQFNKSLSQSEKIVAQKAVQSLGLNLDRAKSDLASMRSRLNEADADYRAGNFEDAMEMLRDLREGENPSVIGNAVLRIREVSRRVKSAKNSNNADQLKTALQQASDSFNNGEYQEVFNIK